MKYTNLLTRSVFIILLFSVSFFACERNKRHYKMLEGKGSITLGGIFRWNETEFIRSLFPHNITEVTGHRCSNQIYEGLLMMSQKDLSIRPCIAKNYEIDESATVYTFHLRSNVFFHNDACFANGKGRVVTAHDFKYCFDLLCTKSPMNKGFWVFENRVVGANTYHELSINNKDLPTEGVSGIVAVNDSTLQIRLEQPFAAFVYILATPFTAVFPKEALLLYGKEMRMKTVGTGPFILKSVIEDEVVILSKNTHYWDSDSLGNKLPYLDGIRISFIKEAQAELLEFKRGNLDQVYRPALEMMEEIYDENGALQNEYSGFVSQHKPSLSLQYYGFLNCSPLFANTDLRKAFCYAIDREKLCRYTLKGTGMPAKYGVVPPGCGAYKSENITGFSYDPVLAKQYLASAGYPDGKGLQPLVLQINAGGGRNQQVAEAVTKMLRDNLNISVEITQLPWAQHLENAETGKVLFWRFGWVADYPDPENFLNLFYGPHVPVKINDNSYINTVRHKSKAFDVLFKKALATTNDTARLKLYNQADSIVINDAPLLPIYYDVEYRLLQNYIVNYPKNSMEFRLLRDVWFDYKN